MTATDPLTAVQATLSDFQRGDIPSILSRVDDSMVWRTPFPPDLVPYGGTQRGKAGVGEFFRKLAGHVDFTTFEVHQFLTGGDTVAVLGTFGGSVRSTGKTFEEDFVFIFSVRDGMLVSMREYTDPTSIARASTPG